MLDFVCDELVCLNIYLCQLLFTLPCFSPGKVQASTERCLWISSQLRLRHCHSWPTSSRSTRFVVASALQCTRSVLQYKGILHSVSKVEQRVTDEM